MRRRGFIILWLHVLGDTNGTEVVLVNMQKYRHTSLYKLKVLWQPCVKQNLVLPFFQQCLLTSYLCVTFWYAMGLCSSRPIANSRNILFILLLLIFVMVTCD